MQTVKEVTIAALRFVRRFGWECSRTGTRGLVRLANGQVEEQVILYTRRGKEVTSRRPVSQEELDRFIVIAYLEDHHEDHS